MFTDAGPHLPGFHSQPWNYKMCISRDSFNKFTFASACDTDFYTFTVRHYMYVTVFIKLLSLSEAEKQFSISHIKLAIYVRGVLGNKCAGHHNLKTVKSREIMFK